MNQIERHAIATTLEKPGELDNAAEAALRRKVWKSISAAIYRKRLLEYFPFMDRLDERPEEKAYSARIIDNIFRYVLSRHKRLLFHVRRLQDVKTVREFVEHESLQETQLKQLWEGMKMRGWHGIGREGKITIDVIKAAIEDADHPDDAPRDGFSIDVLGGKVWSKRLKSELSDRGWDRLYNLVSSIPRNSTRGPQIVNILHGRSLAAIAQAGWPKTLRRSSASGGLPSRVSSTKAGFSEST